MPSTSESPIAAVKAQCAALLGQPIALGTVTVTREMIRAYAARVGDAATLATDCAVAPPTFCLTLHAGMTPRIELPPDVFGVYGGHDLIFHGTLRAGETYSRGVCLSDVYEKSGRSGGLTVVVRHGTIAAADGTPVVEIVERQIIRHKPPATAEDRS